MRKINENKIQVFEFFCWGIVIGGFLSELEVARFVKILFIVVIAILGIISLYSRKSSLKNQE